MSTVLLMTDSWQPTVLRIVPFSQNNAKHVDKKTSGRGNNGAKAFPVLAVTRSGKTEKIMKVNSPESRLTPSRSSASSRSEMLTEPDAAKSEISVATAKESVYSAFTYAVEEPGDEHTPVSKHVKRFQKKMVPKSHTDMTEAIKFPVQDLNEQVSSNSSFRSVESANEPKSNGISKADNTRTKLPKPSLCTSPVNKMYAPINGVRRSVPLTPGELDLKKIRESYVLDQSQKGKKYKLNVNQLPRSTTPINDHDPDKLNMKQVIAFLQTKASRDTRKKSQSPHVKECRSHSGANKLHSNQCAKISLRSIDPNNNIPPRSQTSVAHNERNTPGRESVLSTKSTPTFYSEKRANRYPNSLSSRSHTERSRSKRAELGKYRKPMKEFKLYRFLTVAPDGPYHGLATTVTDAEPSFDVANSNNYVRTFAQNEKKDFLKKSFRSSTTANLLHRRAARKNILTPTNNEEKENEPNLGTIRLPSVSHDHDHDEEVAVVPNAVVADDGDSDSCSTTSATCNSVKYNLEDRRMLPKKGRTLKFQEEIENDSKYQRTNESDVDGVDSESKPVLNNSFKARMYTNPEFPRVNIGSENVVNASGPRQIQINMPQENRNGYSQEIVKLTLRHEKNATRVTSYMSDMQSDKWTQQVGPGSNGFYSANHFNQVRPMDSTLSYSSHKDLYDSPKQIMNSVSNNHFIKVRQKLKSSICDNE